MNYIFDKAREKFGTAQINWLTDTFRAVALIEVHGVLPTMEFLSQVPAASRLGTSVPLASKSVDGGYLKAMPTQFPLLSGAERMHALAVYRATGNEATSDLVLFVDDAAGLPYKPSGLDLYIGWQIANAGVFRL